MFRRFFDLCSVRQVVLSLREERAAGAPPPRGEGVDRVGAGRLQRRARHAHQPGLRGRVRVRPSPPCSQRLRRRGTDAHESSEGTDVAGERWHTLILEHHECLHHLRAALEQILDQTIHPQRPHPGRKGRRRRARGAGAAPGSCALRARRAANALGLLSVAPAAAKATRGATTATRARGMICIKNNAPDGKSARDSGGRPAR